MHSSIIRKLTLALSLSVAPAVALAQTDYAKPKVEEEAGAAQQPADSGAAARGGAAATIEGEADAAQAPKVEGEAGTTAEGEAAAPAEGESGTAETPAAEDQPEATAEGEAAGEADDAETAAGAETSEETTGSIDITTEQRTEIRSIITETHVEPIDLDIDISIGTAVPRTVVLHPLPPRVIEIVPAYQDYMYFVLADGRIVIVDPDSYEIVYIIVV